MIIDTWVLGWFWFCSYNMRISSFSLSQQGITCMKRETANSQIKYSFVFLPANTTPALFSQVGPLQTDRSLSCGLQGQHASVWRRWKPELSKQLSVEVQLHHSDLGTGGHTPRLQPTRQDSPLLRWTGSQLQVWHQQPALQLRPQGPGW